MYRLVVLLHILCALQVGAQADLQLIRATMVRGDVERAFRLIGDGLTRVPPASLDHARLLELKGEQYHRLNDIGEAQVLWDTALRYRQQLFGDSTPEAGVGYAYQARYHNFMAGPQLDHQPLAWREAERAQRLLHDRKGQVLAYERTLALRERGYAYKIAFGFGDSDKHEVHDIARGLYRDALRFAITARDTLWMAQITHDIGNTFTDEVDYFKRTGTMPELVDSARSNYQRSIELLEATDMDPSEAMMMEHFTSALLLWYAYGHDSIAAVIDAYDHALRNMLMVAGRAADVDPLAYEPRVVNKAQMVELLTIRARALVNYPERPDVGQLVAALRSVQAAVPYSQAMLREYRSRDYHKVAGSYNHFPFLFGTQLLVDLHQSTGDLRYLMQAIEWYDLNCDALEQRDRIRSGNASGSAVPPSVHTARSNLPEGTLCIALLWFHHVAALSVDHGSYGSTNILGSKGPFSRWPLTGQALRDAMARNDPRAYRRIAFEIYQNTVQPVLEGKDHRELVMVPGEVFEGIAFEALVTDTLGEATWAGMHYLMDRYTIRYARSINEALQAPVDVRLQEIRTATSLSAQGSHLPFAEALVKKLQARYPEHPSIGTATRNDVFELLRGTAPFHLASHAVAPSAPDELPYLLLHDGPLTLRDIDSVGCRASFVVLSTCSSGEGRVFRGEGAISLGNAMLRGGAHTVVQTLWPVDDQATSEILGLMYNGMNEGLSVSDALCEAKRTFVREHANDPLSSPFYWSGIVVTGAVVKPTEVILDTTWGFLAGGSLLFLLTLGVWRYKRSKRAKSSRLFAES